MSRNDITGDLIRSRPNTADYEQKRSQIFGSERKTGSWVYDPETRKLVPKQDFLREKPRPKPAGFFIGAKEFEAFESPATGEVITSRRAHEYDLKASGCRISEGRASEEKEAMKWRAEQDQKLDSAMRETLYQTHYEIEHGYRRPQE